jgi:Uncharacterized protein conserved in bacteria (DUF2325)
MYLAPQKEVRCRTELQFLPSRPIQLLTPTEGQKARRRKIWELSPSLHCSIVGTCVSTADLRRLVAKLSSSRVSAASDHEIHKIGVSLASDAANGAKLLHKLLDQRHETILKRFNKAEDVKEIRRLWEDFRAKGEIPGAYWAVLTHPIADEELARDVFGDVHMLSHLVGAANRADIRRLAELERENARLLEKTLKQQDHLQKSHAARQHEVAHLRSLLAEHQAMDPLSEEGSEPALESVDRFKCLAERLQRQLGAETERRRRAESVNAQLCEDVRTLDRSVKRHESDIRQREAVIASLEAFIHDKPCSETETHALKDKVVLYVGGRTHSATRLGVIAERFGATVLHHDGGAQESGSLLQALLARADHVFFPVDCVSHDAALAVKRACKRRGTAYTPLQSAGLGSFLHALTRISAGDDDEDLSIKQKPETIASA